MDRNRDPEKKRAKDKRYREKHKDVLNEKEKQKFANNKEEINERRKEIAAELKITNPEMAAEIAEKRLKYLQAYRELNLAKTRQCWKIHTGTMSHINKMKENPDFLNQEMQFQPFTQEEAEA
jgi:hypothetical protein